MRNSKSPNASSSHMVASLQRKKLERLIRSWLTPDDAKPTLIFLAGCNGAGKSSFFAHLAALSASQPIFLNADLIALILRGIPAADVIAQKITDGLREHLLGQRVTFVTETVFSDEVGAKLDYLRRAKAAGFRIVLVYVSLESWPLSKLRVERRVKTGGHAVDVEKLPRRWLASHENARRALLFVDDGLIFDNSSYENPMRLVATTHGGALSATFGMTPPHLTSILPPATATASTADDHDSSASSEGETS